MGARAALRRRRAHSPRATTRPGTRCPTRPRPSLYRLAASPGRRALLGMEPRRGRLVRPLLEVTREDTREWCRARGLEWREDPTNDDTDYARARVRHEVMPQLRELEPGRRAEHRRDRPPPARRAGAARARPSTPRSSGSAPRRSSPRCARSPRRLARLVLAAPRRRAACRPPARRRSCALADQRHPRAGRRGRCPRPWSSTATCASRAARTPRRPTPSPCPCPARCASATGRWRRALGEVGRGGRSPPTSSGAQRDRARLARRRPDAARRAWAARSRSRTCSPTARCRARCAARCRWSRPAARSSGWPAWRPLSAVAGEPCRARRAPGQRCRWRLRSTSKSASSRACSRRTPRAGPCRAGAAAAASRSTRGRAARR